MGRALNGEREGSLLVQSPSPEGLDPDPENQQDGSSGSGGCSAGLRPIGAMKKSSHSLGIW